MVLQLVLPQTEISLNSEVRQYDGVLPGSVSGGPSLPFPAALPENSSGGEGSAGSDHGLLSSSKKEQVRGVSSITVTPAPLPVWMSIRAEDGSAPSNNTQGSTPVEKQEMFREYLSIILSCIYGAFIVTLGIVIYVADILHHDTPLAESFSIYLVTVGLIYLVVVYADIRKYSRMMQKRKEIWRAPTFSSIAPSIEGSVEYSLAGSAGELSREKVKFDTLAWFQNPAYSLPGHSEGPPEIDLDTHQYCFSRGRHSGSFYLKIGAAGFCFGHLIHSGLLLGYQVVILMRDFETFNQCSSIPTLLLDIIYPIYSFFQLFFIFKYSNVIVNRHKEIHRFAVMHCIASSLCFWLWTILRETRDSLREAQVSEQELSRQNTDEVIEQVNGENNQQILVLLNLNTSYQRSCKGQDELSEVFDKFSPYLYPFTIEYSILVVGILYMIWRNIGACSGGCQSTSSSSSGYVSPVGTSNLIVHADCHAANKGLFAGLIIFVLSVVSIILFFISRTNKDLILLGHTVSQVTELGVLVIMTICSGLAYRQMTKLDVNPHPVSLLDDLLLFVSIPAFFTSAILGVVPALQRHDYFRFSIIIIQVIQVLVQTPFIADGLRRCSNTRVTRLHKPGRELITFLIVANVALWVAETFLAGHRIHPDNLLSTVLGHMTQPLTMFYRFHSSVCLVDIWQSAYQTGN